MAKPITARSRAADMMPRARAMIRALVAAGLISIPAGALLGGTPETGQVPGKKYYESTVEKTCTSATSCIFKFAFVPAGLLLRASNVSCFVNIQMTGTEFAVMQLIQGPVSDPVFKNFFPVTALGAQTASPGFVMNQPILAFFKAGTQPMVLVNAGQTVPTIAGQCKLAGDLVTP